jgi:hypothetical protein
MEAERADAFTWGLWTVVAWQIVSWARPSVPTPSALLRRRGPAAHVAACAVVSAVLARHLNRS